MIGFGGGEEYPQNSQFLSYDKIQIISFGSRSSPVMMIKGIKIEVPALNQNLIHYKECEFRWRV
jgi:hypothetical protein